MDKPTTATVIGKRVATLRESKGISRRAFALTVKMPLTNYRDREFGRQDFSLPQLTRISAELGVDLESWFKDLPESLAA